MSESLAFQLRDEGNKLRKEGRLKDAVEKLRQALASWRNLARQTPSANSRRNLSIGLNDLSAALHAVGGSAEALDLYQESLEILGELLDADPDNSELLGDQAITFLWTSTTCVDMKHWDEALDTANGAIAIFSKLIENNPGDTRVRFHYALALQRRAIAMAEIGASVRAPVPQAMADAESSRSIIRDLLKGDPSNPAFKDALAVSERLYERLWPQRRAAP